MGVRGKSITVEGTVSAKALGPMCDRCALEMASRSVCSEWREYSAKFRSGRKFSLTALSHFLCGSQAYVA